MLSRTLQRITRLVMTVILILLGVSSVFASVVINDGDAYTTLKKVTLKVAPPDDTYTLMSTSADNVKWGKWVPTAATAVATLSAGDGTKSIYIKYRTAAGVESATESDTIILDSKAPKGTVTINAGVAVTNSRNVILEFSVTDANPVAEFQYSTVSGVWSAWEPYVASKQVELPAGDGTKNVQVRFKDAAGKVSVPIKGKISLDTTPPTGTLIVNKGAAVTHYPQVSAVVKAAGKPTQMRIHVDGTPVGDWQAFAKIFSVTLPDGDGDRAVGVVLRDAAGNESDPVADTINLATSPAAYTGKYVGVTGNGETYISVTVATDGAISGTAQPTGGEHVDVSGTVDGAGVLTGIGIINGAGEPPVTFKGTIENSMVIKASNGETATLAKIPAGDYAGNYVGEFGFVMGNTSGSIKIGANGAITGTVTENGSTFPVTGVVTETGAVFAVVALADGGKVVAKGKFSGTNTITWTYRSTDESGTGTPFVRKIKSSSFDPQTADGGMDTPLYWVYEINGGQTINTYYGQVDLAITPTEFRIDQDPELLKRTTSFLGSLTGDIYGQSFKGSYNAKVVQSIEKSGGITTLKDQLLNMVLSIKGEGSATVSAKTDSFSPPYEWFLDRSDLDILPVGHTQNVSSSAKTTVTFSSNLGLPNQSGYANVSDTWKVAEKLATMTVKGKQYSNVVKVTRATQMPDFNGSLSSVTITYWVAKGIGIIKAQNLMRILNMDNLSFELTATNLAQ